METQSFADLEMLQAALKHVFSEWVQQLDLRVLEARAGEVVLVLPVTRKHVHEGGVLCGQTMMAAADTAMVLAVMTKLGGFKPMTTVQLQTSFLRPFSRLPPGFTGPIHRTQQVTEDAASIRAGPALQSLRHALSRHGRSTGDVRIPPWRPESVHPCSIRWPHPPERTASCPLAFASR